MANIGHELLNVPFPEMVKSMGVGIAQAQFELDLMGMRLAQMMSGEKYYIEEEDEEGTLVEEEQDAIKVKFGGAEYSLLELGFTPTFYQFVDTIIEVKMSISMSREMKYTRSQKTVKVKGKVGLGFFSTKASARISTVSASFSNRYQYTAEGSSLLRTKLVPVPPPAVLEERIRLMLEA
jgi:hypothetical protein